MSTTAMWLLLAVVVIVIVFASVLYKRTFTVHELALTGVMAALSLVAYLFFRVPFYGGSSFHLGNTFTALTALLLDGVSGGLAGAIGLALADILAGDPGYAVTTFVLKFLIGITCGAVAHKVFKLRVLDRAVAVERAYRACLVVAVELRVERAQRFLRRVECGGGVFAVGGQIHHRVHRVDRACLAHFLLLSLAAGGEGQRERHSQNGCQYTFCHSFLRKNEAFVSVPAARAPVSRR